MSKYLLLFSVITFVFSIVFTLKKVDSAIFFEKPTPQKESLSSLGVGVSNNIELKKLINSKSKKSFLADEYHLSWDLVSPEFMKTRVFVLTYTDLDKFQYSCLTQVLDEKGLKKEAKLINNSYFVKVILKKEDEAKKLLSRLDNYDINGHYKELLQFKENFNNEK